MGGWRGEAGSGFAGMTAMRTSVTPTMAEVRGRWAAGSGASKDQTLLRKRGGQARARGTGQAWATACGCARGGSAPQPALTRPAPPSPGCSRGPRASFCSRTGLCSLVGSSPWLSRGRRSVRVPIAQRKVKPSRGLGGRLEATQVAVMPQAGGPPSRPGLSVAELPAEPSRQRPWPRGHMRCLGGLGKRLREWI